MFGSMAMFRPRQGKDQEFKDLLLGESAALCASADGYIAEYLLVPEAADDDWISFVVFDSEASYRKHAEHPDGHASYLKLRALVVADPVWHDGAVSLGEPSSVSI